MALVERFEDILAWQEAQKLVGEIYKLTNSGMLAKNYGLKDHLQRASVSTSTNIAEGFDCDLQVEFACFLGIARCLAVEAQSLLCAGLNVGYIDQKTFDAEYKQARKTKALIGGFKNALKKRNP